MFSEVSGLPWTVKDIESVGTFIQGSNAVCYFSLVSLFQDSPSRCISCPGEGIHMAFVYVIVVPHGS